MLCSQLSITFSLVLSWSYSDKSNVFKVKSPILLNKLLNFPTMLISYSISLLVIDIFNNCK